LKKLAAGAAKANPSSVQFLGTALRTVSDFIDVDFITS